MKTNNELKKHNKVNLVRSNLSAMLAASLPEFVFWNAGTIHKLAGDRVCVAWPGSGFLWFDADAVVAA